MWAFPSQRVAQLLRFKFFFVDSELQKLFLKTLHPVMQAMCFILLTRYFFYSIMKYNRLSAPWAALQPSILLQTMYIQIKDKENDLYLSQSLSLTHSCLSLSASIFRLKLLMLISFFLSITLFLFAILSSFFVSIVNWKL